MLWDCVTRGCGAIEISLVPMKVKEPYQNCPVTHQDERALVSLPEALNDGSVVQGQRLVAGDGQADQGSGRRGGRGQGSCACVLRGGYGGGRRVVRH